MSAVRANRINSGWDSNHPETKAVKNYFTAQINHLSQLEDPRIKQITEKMEAFTSKPAPTKRERSSPRQFPVMGASVIQIPTQPTMMDSLTRIRSLFPTVPETHIKALLIKYHGREAVVISALQVEKHPVTTPGPFTPPPGRVHPPIAPRSPHSPLARRPQPKPHSPKMKLRYLKSVFPVVEETLLLDTLCSADNNVTFATQRLIRMGYDKKDTPTPQPRISLKKDTKKEKEIKKSPPPPPRQPTEKEKEDMKKRLCAKYKEIPERVVLLAIDSADFNEKTAETILSFTIKEKGESSKGGECSDGTIVTEQLILGEGEAGSTCSVNNIKSDKAITLTNQKASASLMSQTVKIPEDKSVSPKKPVYKSELALKPKGPDPKLPKGPNPALLLRFREDYVPWVGAERGLARGPEPGLAEGPRPAIGPDLSLRVGPRARIYSRQLTSPNDSRGN